MERPLSDTKLGEVRAVLERLQTFAADPDSTQPPAEASNSAVLNGPATSAHKGVTTGEPQSSEYEFSIYQFVAKPRAAAIGLGITGAAVMLLGVVWLVASPGNR